MTVMTAAYLICPFEELFSIQQFLADVERFGLAD